MQKDFETFTNSNRHAINRKQAALQMAFMLPGQKYAVIDPPNNWLSTLHSSLPLLAGTSFGGVWTGMAAMTPSTIYHFLFRSFHT
jgi:hypothetical protein